MPARSRYVAVVGASQATEAHERDAEQVGTLLARAGAIVITGGRGGVMAAASRGANQAGGIVIGLLPGASRADANEWVTIALPTGIGELRNGLIVRAAEAVVAVGGAYGTLSEVALALAAGVPVVGLNTWQIDGVEQAQSPEQAVRRALSGGRRRRPPRLNSATMPTFKDAYLIHGDDHGRIAERRARLRELAESISGAQGIELFEADDAAPDTVAGALNAMTLVLARRFIIVDGTERWRDKDLDALERAVRAIAPETTVAFFAREDSRNRAPDRLHAIVKHADGDISAEQSVKPWELPKWVTAHARELGLALDPEAARALIRHVGERQQRLQRELEKLALGIEDPSSVTILDAAQIIELTASSAERKAWAVADALVAGDREAAVRAYLSLREHGERVSGLLYWISQRLRTAHEIAAALDAGEPPAQVKKRLRMPSRAADKLIADARRTGSEQLREAICEIADLELASRGGGKGGAGEDTAALTALQRIAA